MPLRSPALRGARLLRKRFGQVAQNRSAPLRPVGRPVGASFDHFGGVTSGCGWLSVWRLFSFEALPRASSALRGARLLRKRFGQVAQNRSAPLRPVGRPVGASFDHFGGVTSGCGWLSVRVFFHSRLCLALPALRGARLLRKRFGQVAQNRSAPLRFGLSVGPGMLPLTILAVSRLGAVG